VTAFGKNGDPFDPTLHEAVIHDTSPDVDYSMVTTVLRPGFRRGERVLRTAMVAVTDPEVPAMAEREAGPAADAPSTGTESIGTQSTDAASTDAASTDKASD
jgi:molecular chaperone GrpE